MADIICKECSASNPEGTKFCVECGKLLESELPVLSTGNEKPEAKAEEEVSPKKVAPVGTGKFMAMMFVMAIPVIGWILTLCWAFGKNVNKNVKGYARAVFNWFIIALVIGVILFVLYLTVGQRYSGVINEFLSQFLPALGLIK